MIRPQGFSRAVRLSVKSGFPRGGIGACHDVGCTGMIPPSRATAVPIGGVMASTRIANSKKPRLSLDRSIERMRKHLAELALFVKKGKAARSLEEFDSESERLIAELLGETSSLLDAYQYAQLGEAAGLVNMTEEAPESVGLDGERQNLMQRSRVLESCVSELEARRAVEPKKLRQALTGPQVAEHMSADL